MSEDEARALLAARVPRGTMAAIERYAALLLDASTTQNLISPATRARLWERHILDSAQLAWEPAAAAPLLDVGSGAGLPGMVLALMLDGPVTLAEPRALRAGFLAATAAALGLTDRVTVAPLKAQRLAPARFATITARAVAPIAELLAMTAHCADGTTRWLLPRGRGAPEDVAAARRLWQGRYATLPSLTDSEAGIVVVTELVRRQR